MKKESVFNIIVGIVIFIAMAALVYSGYSLRRCPEYIIPQEPYRPPAVDTFYITEIQNLKPANENNPYRPIIVDTIAVFDSIAKYYGY